MGAPQRRLAASGGAPAWVPRAGGVAAPLAADFAGQRYWYRVAQPNFAAFLAALGGTFTRASTGMYVGSNGLLQTAGNNVLRFAYDPVTLALLGIMSEAAATNRALHSQAFDNADWTPQQSTVTADTTAAPDGTLSADTLTGNASGASFYLIRPTVAPSLGANQPFTVSAYVKPGTSSFAFLQAFTSAGNYVSAAFNLANTSGAATQTSSGGGAAGTILGSSISVAPNGFRRIVLSGQINAVNPNFGIGQAAGATGNTFDTSGTVTNAPQTLSLILWGAQFEGGSIPTSYIITSTTSVTRAADLLSWPLGSWHNPNGWTLGGGLTNPSASATQLVISVHDGTLNNRAQFSGSAAGAAANLFVRTANVTQATFNTGGTVVPNWRSAAAFASSGFAIDYNGGTVATQASGTLPVVNIMEVGSVAGSTPGGIGLINKIYYFPFRVSNSDLVSLTQ